ncbi:MAG: radical SAM protein [Candidatus Aminicenantes bacterium]|nr:radical SAM protein [Candidatus Aminicenantes bacterium]
MEITNLTFIVTDDCNYNCSYCPQKKEKKTITHETIGATVDFFYPLLHSKHKVYIGFYGGEPLLAFDKIQSAVRLLLEKNKKENKNLEFTMTTNGSLLTGEMLEFFNAHHFALQLSFDGLAQDKGRKKGSLAHMLRAMNQIRAYPGISFDINSVFSPQTVGDLSGSLRFIIEQEGPDITFNLADNEKWDPAHLDTLKKELAQLTDFLAQYYKKTGKVPVKNFRPSASKPGIFRCGAGLDHMAVTPEGKLWGCFLFHDYFKTRKDDPQYREYSFGALGDFIENYETAAGYPAIKANYSELRQDFYRVEGNDCFLCREVGTCRVCPINAAYATGSLGKISCQKCQLMKIEKNTGTLFNHTLKKETPGPCKEKPPLL